jgi:hypothetical protein
MNGRQRAATIEFFCEDEQNGEIHSGNQRLIRQSKRFALLRVQ